jgi:tetratricopeptide (TPR) repeat protein
MMNRALTAGWCLSHLSKPGILLSTVFLCAVSAYANPNEQGWNLLIDNKPVEAKEIFLKNTSDRNKAVRGEAFRGLSQVSRFLDQDEDAARYFFQSCLNDNNALLFSAGVLNTYAFARTATGSDIKEGYRLLGDLAKKPSLFSGEFNDMLAERYANDGDVPAAMRLVNDMGAIRKWMFIGPFDNISNSGYNKAYPPETEIKLDKIYPAKDGNKAKWNQLDNTAPTGWIFTEHHCTSRNAVVYYYCTVTSDETREVNLAFGASGSFKIFLNGTCVCADSVYRNTGADVFMQRVTLHKGANPLLVKLCHEWSNRLSGEIKLSNFFLRFLDKGYSPLKKLSYATVPAAPAPEKAASYRYAPSPLIDTVVGVLTGRLAKNAGDMDAALLLMQAYNGMEKFDEGQVLAQGFIKKFPKSSLWHQFYGESLLRSKKYTDGETAMKTVYTLCPLNFIGWQNELQVISQTSEARKVLEFIASSPEVFRSSLSALVATLYANFQLENSADALKTVADIEKKYALNQTALTVLAGVYVQQGQIKKAETLIRDFLARQHTSTLMYKTLASLALKQGDMGKVTDIIQESLKYSPHNAGLYYLLANLNYTAKNFSAAHENIEKSLGVMPADADALNLKGNIALSLGNKQEAKQAFTDAIDFTSDDFNAWDNLRGLDGKPPLESLAPLPPVDSLIKASEKWQYRTHENGAVLSRASDVFYYPSRCSRERYFFVVYLATQKAIDTWKERDIEYNSYFQVAHIARALSYRANGSQVQADVQSNKVVFKSLQPGDCIVLEWSLKNFYTGDMAGQVHGSQEFDLSHPAFDSRLRLITPVKDTIPYRVFGDSISVSTVSRGDYRVTQFLRPAYKNVLDETFTATDWATKEKVNYSTFSGWNDIAKWYDDLTRHKQDNTLELKALADSLFAGCAAPLAKVAKVHEYITGNIRYSYVPFRQSGWIPQEAHDVLATKIGDCKDMASLGKSLLDCAGIPSCLTLVNTEVRHFTDHACVGPEFNHCILCYTLNGQDRFLDCTDNNLPLATLPRQDQGALALVIRPGTTGTILLPIDKPEARVRRRTVVSTLDEKGTLKEKVATLRTGVFAGNFRDSFRFLSEEKRNVTLHQSLAQAYPDITLDTFSLQGLNTVGDTLTYDYASTARNTVTFSGNTAIFPLRISDNIEPNEYPVEEKRTFPIDMYFAWYDISSCELSGELTYPATWRPISLPDNVSADSPFGSYRLEFKRKGNTLHFKRTAVMNFNAMIPAAEHERLKTFLNKVSKADAIQVLFYTK